MFRRAFLAFALALSLPIVPHAEVRKGGDSQAGASLAAPSEAKDQLIRREHHDQAAGWGRPPEKTLGASDGGAANASTSSYLAQKSQSQASGAEREDETVAANELLNASKPHGTGYGHALPWPEAHWQYSKYRKRQTFRPNGGKSQMRMDPAAKRVKTLKANPALIKEAIEKTKHYKGAFGARDNASKARPNAKSDANALKAAEGKAGSKFSWSKASSGMGGATAPTSSSIGDGVTAFTKWFHSQWKNQTSHRKSAYEPDFWRDNSEYFGPFRLDYHDRTVYVDDWNVRVRTKKKQDLAAGTGGTGNAAVGPAQYMGLSTNSFMAGKHGTVKGDSVVVLGGKENVAKGTWSFVAGGTSNVASGPYSSVTGGSHNKAKGKWSKIVGGQNNEAEKSWSVVLGGDDGTSQAKLGAVAGGRGNSAQGKISVVLDGIGNKAIGPLSTVNGGEGQVSLQKFQLFRGKKHKKHDWIKDEQKMLNKVVH